MKQQKVSIKFHLDTKSIICFTCILFTFYLSRNFLIFKNKIKVCFEIKVLKSPVLPSQNVVFIITKDR